MASSVYRSIRYACAMTYNKLPSTLAPQATLAPPSSTIVHAYIHNVFTGKFFLVSGGSCLGCFVRVFFVWKVLFGVVFVRPPFCQNTSVTSEGARRSSGIEAAIGSRGLGSRPVYYFAVQRPWTSR